MSGYQSKLIMNTAEKPIFTTDVPPPGPPIIPSIFDHVLPKKGDISTHDKIIATGTLMRNPVIRISSFFYIQADIGIWDGASFTRSYTLTVKPGTADPPPLEAHLGDVIGDGTLAVRIIVTSINDPNTSATTTIEFSETEPP